MLDGAVLVGLFRNGVEMGRLDRQLEESIIRSGDAKVRW